MRLCPLLRDGRGSAAAEMALVTPLLLIVMFGSMEMGNFMLTQHALSKQTRDGARFASRLEFADTGYACAVGDTSSIWKAGDAVTQIENVVKTGTVDGTGDGRFEDPIWSDDSKCDGATPTVDVGIVRCVDQDDSGLGGLYTDLEGEIPVVRVSTATRYQPLLAPVAVSLVGRCMRAEAEMPVTGL